MAPQIVDMLAMERESDVDGAWMRAKLHLRMVRRRMDARMEGAEMLSVLEAVCVDEATPRIADWLRLLRQALDEVADHLRLAR